MAAPTALRNFCITSNILTRICGKYATDFFGLHTEVFINTSSINQAQRIKNGCLICDKISKTNVGNTCNRISRGMCGMHFTTPETLFSTDNSKIPPFSEFCSKKCGARLYKRDGVAARKTPQRNVWYSTLLGHVAPVPRGYCTVSRACWSCNAQTKLADKQQAQFFCDTCNAVQPVNPDANFFRTMNCEETFDIDTEQLVQTFRDLQRKLHPDKFSIKSKREQDYSAMQSSEVNKAYSTLLKPLSRGLYLLELNGLTIEEGDAGIEPEFLMEVMETNEELAETSEEATIRRIGEENAVKLEAFLKDLSKAFSEKNYPEAREILMRLKYFSNINDKVKEKLEKGF